MFFTPKWKKDAQHLAKGARKFVHYKRDLLKPDRVDEIESRRSDLLAAVKSGDRAKVDEASKQLQAVCEQSLPGEKPVGWFEENVEVMFVAIVIALGLRAYYLQPFRIPTGSMQPTLNGIVGTAMPEKDWPSFPVRMWELAARGRSYVKVVTSKDMQVPIIGVGPDGRFKIDLRDSQFLHFFSRSVIRSADGSTLRMPAPATPIYDAGLQAAIDRVVATSRPTKLPALIEIPAGTVLCEGRIDTGDLVLVDKFSYHFRKPKRGEVFVFNTQGIRGIQERGGEQGAGSHYIKRLCGVPGDELSIQSPNLLVNGRIAQEKGIQRVIRAEGVYAKNPQGYCLAFGGSDRDRKGNVLPKYLVSPGDKLALADKTRPGMREYAALGDNTGNSLDSRYWGRVKEYNLVGPALFSLWPFTTGHWGLID